MAAIGTAKVELKLTGLGEGAVMSEKFDITTAPTVASYNYRVLGVAGTEEALDLGDITTPHLIWIKAIDKHLKVDTSYSVAFSDELIVHAGEVAIFKPGGTVYVLNKSTGETPSYEFLALGV